MRRLAGVVGALVLLVVACGGPSDPLADPLPEDRRLDDPAAAVPDPPAPAGLHWTTGAEMPTPRTEVAAAALGGLVYVVGGFEADGRTSRAVEVYDPATDAWTSAVPLPVGLHHTALAMAGGRLYVIGGYPAAGVSDGVWSWAPGEGEWRAEPPLPTARGALAVAVVHEAAGFRIHAAGGATGLGGAATLTGAHEVFDGESWESLEPLPGPRDHLSAAAHDGAVYVIGGRELSMARNLDRVDVYEDGSWRSAEPLPTARGGLAAATVGDHIVVFGGEEPAGTFDEAELYDTGTREWLAGPAMPTARHGLGAATIDDRVYVLGGGPEPGLTVSAANEILVMEP